MPPYLHPKLEPTGLQIPRIFCLRLTIAVQRTDGVLPLIIGNTQLGSGVTISLQEIYELDRFSLSRAK